MLGFLFRRRRAAAVTQALEEGTRHLQRGAPAEAYALLARAAALAPDNADVLLLRGNALHALGRLPEAAADFERSLALAPHYAGAAHNLGHTLRTLGRSDAALAALDRAISLRPDYPDAINLRGVALTELDRHADALACFERLREVAPEYPDVLGNIAYAAAHIARWDARARVLPGIAEAVRRGQRLAAPFVQLGITDDPGVQLACARAYAAPALPALWRGERYAHPRIRVAYLSANFHDHAVSYLMAGVLEGHDRARFEVTGVSYGPPDTRAMRARIAAACDRFVDVRAAGDDHVAQMLREMEIDIAVDLMGHTGEARPGILARRPAPVQVSYLGYPGTTGGGAIDYVLADRFVIPESARAYYSEQVVHLPETFQANDDRRPRAATAPARAALGLPEDAFVFCSFNNAYKITPEMYDVWMRVVQNVERSVLWLFGGNSELRDNLARAAAARGVDPARVVFAAKADYATYLARYRAADLFLDTFPFNGGTTASDALWCGLPVLTCAGRAFAARMAGSLLTTLGLADLVTHSLAEYEAKAIALAAEPGALAACRATLAGNAGSLFDTPRFCRRLEAAYATMHAIAGRGEPPRSFAADED